MRKYISFLLCASLLFASCQDNEIDKLNGQLDSLENEQIASLSEQVSHIFSSIETLTGMGSQIQNYIDVLDNTADQLETNIAIVTEAIASLKSELQSDMDQAKAEVLAEFESVKSALETELEDVRSTIAAITSTQTALDVKVDSLRQYTDENYAKADWLTGTFATLESQNAIFDDVADIKERISALNASNLEIEKLIKDRLEMRLGFMNSGYDKNIVDMVNTIKGNIDDIISNASKSIQDACTKKLSESIKENEDSLKEWVNGKLVDYFTVAGMEAKEKAFYDLVGNVKEGESLQSQIEGVLDSLKTVKDLVVGEYKTVLAEAIQNSEAKLTGVLAGKISALRTDVIDPLEQRVTNLESEITKLYTKVGELKERINTVDVQISAINSTISILDTLDQTLQQYIETMSAQLSLEDEKQFKELKAMIEQLQALANGADAESVQSQITALKNYVGTFTGTQQTVAEWVKSTLETLDNQFSNYATVNQIDIIKKDIDSTVLSQSGRITAVSEALDTLLSSSRKSIDSWIDKELESYYTTDSLTSLISALRVKMDTTIGNADKELSAKIVELDTLLSVKAKEVRDAYKNAISDAITNYDGYVTETIKNAIQNCVSKVTSYQSMADSLGGELETLSGKIEALGLDIDTLKGISIILSDFIKDSGYSSLNAVLEYFNGEIEACKTKYAALSDYNELYALVYGADGTGTVSGLKYEASRIQGVMDGLAKAEDDCSAIEKFLDGYDFESDTLKNVIEAIDTDIDELLEEVFGNGSAGSIQSRIDEILKALYGKSMSSASISAESIFGKLQAVEDQLIYIRFSSIQRVPNYSDGREQLLFDGSKYVGCFQFDVRPSGLAAVIAASKSAEMKYAEPVTKASAIVRSFDKTSFEAFDDGTLFVKVELASNKVQNYVPTGGSAALYVDIRSEKSNTSAVTFTSGFFQFDVPSDNELTEFYCNNPVMGFESGTDSHQVTIVRNKNWQIESIPSWITLDGASVGEKYNKTRTFTVTASANDSPSPRSGQVVFCEPNKSIYRTIFVYQAPSVGN